MIGYNTFHQTILASIFGKIAIDLMVHLRKEEEDFFPALKRVDSNKKTGTTQAAKDTETIKESMKNLTVQHEDLPLQWTVM